jgi:RNA polymerase sigma-70 factor (ECF subfamily)
MHQDDADARLRERLVNGDGDALAEAYDRWATLVYTVARRVTGDKAAAEDVTQDVFLRLWQAPERYDPDRGPLRWWLSMAARGRAVDLVRSRTAAARRHAVAAMPQDEAEPDELVTWQMEVKVVQEAVRALPEAQRAAVHLAYYRGRTYRQVAEDLGIPEGTAKSRLRQALASLHARLAAQGFLDP